MTAWTVLFVAAALLSLVEFARAPATGTAASYLSDREANATHVTMNLSMAAMMSAAYARLEIVIVAACALAMALLALRLLSHLFRAQHRPLMFGSAYHLLSVAAMLYAVRLMPPMEGAMHMAHPWPATALGAVFALDGLATAWLAGAMPDRLLRMGQATGLVDAAAASAPDAIAAIRRSAIPHIVMDAGMAVMLLR